jgi:hypothetical protein
MDRETFPTKGIYRAEPGAIQSKIAADPGRYNCLRPAAYVLTACEIFDCWIVDPAGKRYPGCSLYPVPFHRSALGERVR